MTAHAPSSDAAVLRSVEIPNPCTESWDTMRGDEQVRHCGVCKKNVYNLSAMPQAQEAALVTANVDGDLCVRFYRRSDGTMMNSDCSTSPRVKLHRAMRTLPRMAAGAAGAAGVAAMVAAVAHAAPGQPTRPDKKPTVVEVAIVKEEPPLMGAPPPVLMQEPPVGRISFSELPLRKDKPQADPAPAAQPPANSDKGNAVR